MKIKCNHCGSLIGQEDVICESCGKVIDYGTVEDFEDEIIDVGLEENKELINKIL
jgi:hypothetical protein